MIRVLKYVKKSWWCVILVVGLLYAQAQCELALPDYMSSIVSNGIQASGIDSPVPEMMSKETLDKAVLFVEDKEKVLLKYELAQSEKELPYAIDKPFKKDTVYVLKESKDIEDDTLRTQLGQSLLMYQSINQIEAGKMPLDDSANQMIEQLPAGMSLFDAFTMMPKEQIQEFKQQSLQQLESMGESTISIAGASVVKAEYEALGVTIADLQNNYIFSAGLSMLVIALGGALCAIIVGYFSSLIAAVVSRDMRKDVFEKVESFSNTEFNKFSTASLITRSTNDIQQIQMATVMIFRIVIYAPIMGVGAVIRVLDADASMIGIIACTVVLIMSIIAILFAFVSPKFKMMQKLVDRLNLVMRETLSGMLVIRAFQTEEIEENRFDEANKNMMKTNLFTGRSMAAMMPIIMFIMNAVTLVIVWVGGHQVDAGSLQIGDMMAFLQYAMQIIMSFMMIAMVSIFLPRASVAAKRVYEIIDMPLSIADPKQPKSFNEEIKGTVAFNNVSFRYPNAEEDVLTDINFVAKPGEVTAFIGSTGSGKSTIINLVPRFFDVTSGNIEVDGIDIREVSQHALREKIGLVPQKGTLFQGSIASNIKYSDYQMSDEEMEDAATVAQAIDFISAKEDKFDSEIAQEGSNVSGGQKQRISIARAIAKRPEIFIFDDSFSALDFKTDAKLREALDVLCKQTKSTVLLVGQRIASIMHANQIIVLEEGRMVGRGTHQQLLETCDVYKEIAYSQLSKEELENA